jgi:dihydrofolate synthase/folylpolyglutamate synthase
MDYQQTLDYLFSRLPMFSRIGAAAYNKDLGITRQLCAALGDPQHRFRTIHVAGTNGKGSVSHMLAAILQTEGYKTGLYTSPHLKDFRERIRINGEMCPEPFITSFTEKIKPLIEELSPSFFEITVAMAFDFFAEEKVDIAVIETGLGGRYDSTNIITPEVSVITNIGWDHMNILGDSLEKIAFEKAGIIKKNIPVIVGEVRSETENIFREIAHEMDSPLTIASEKRKAINWSWEKHQLMIETTKPDSTDHLVYSLDLAGIYQLKNLLTVLETCSCLRKLGWEISEEHTRKGLQQTKKMTGLHGRWDVIHQDPLVVLDVAHNEDGVKQLMEQVEVTEHDHLHIILGFVKDKDVEKILSYFPGLATYYFTKANIPRALPESVLAEQAAAYGLEGKTFAGVNLALQSALSNAGKKDLVLICGSVFLVGEVEGGKV